MHRNNRDPVPLWQLALYVAVLGVISMLLAPLTSLWWIVPLVGAAIPLAMVVIQGREHQGVIADDVSVATPGVETRVPGDGAPPGPDWSRTLEATASPAAGASTGAPQLAELESDLSEREMEVLTLLASGKTNAEVADALFISVGTVKSHSANIYRKLEAKNRTEAVARARERGLMQ